MHNKFISGKCINCTVIALLLTILVGFNSCKIKTLLSQDQRINSQKGIESPNTIPYITKRDLLPETEQLEGEILKNQRDNEAFANRSWQGITSIGIDKNGYLFVAWYSGAVGEGAGNYVTLSVSKDQGLTWEANKIIINPTNPKVRFFDPALWNDKYGNLILFWSKSGRAKVWDGKGGVWFSKIRYEKNNVVYDQPMRLSDGVMLNKPITTKDGMAALFPIANFDLQHEDAEEKKPFIYKAFYQDSYKNLINFQKIGYLSVENSIRKFDEHQIVELKDKTFLGMIRTTDGIYYGYSQDGVTWNTFKKFVATGPTPTSRFHVSRLKSGNIALVLNNSPGRKNLTVYLSEDEGATWKYGLKLEQDKTLDFNVSYPDLVQGADGRIFVIYDFDRFKKGNILLSSFTEKDIIENNVKNIRKIVVDHLQ